MKYVRIKPLNKKRGNMIRKYNIFGHVFHVDDGWYAIADEPANLLAEKTVDPYDPSSSKVFDVVSSTEEALAIERQEREQEMIAARRRDYRGPRSAQLVKQSSGGRLVEPKPRTSAATKKIKVQHMGEMQEAVENSPDYYDDEEGFGIDPMIDEEGFEIEGDGFEEEPLELDGATDEDLADLDGDEDDEPKPKAPRIPGVNTDGKKADAKKATAKKKAKKTTAKGKKGGKKKGDSDGE